MRARSFLAVKARCSATCFDSTEYDAAIQASFTAGRDIGVNSTPTFFVNGRRLEGAPAAMVEQRLQSLKTEIGDAWEELNCCYALIIEPEIHWRLGKPAAQPREGKR